MNVPASAITVLPASSLTRSRSQIPRGISSRRAAPVSRCTGYTARCRATSPGSCGRRVGPGGRTTPPRVLGAGVLFVVRTHSLPFTRKETTRCPTLSAPLSRRSPHLLRPAAPPSLLVRLSRAPPRATALARVPDGAGRRRPGNDGRDLIYYWVVIHEGALLMAFPSVLAMPFLLRTLILGWLRRPPGVRPAPEQSGVLSS